MSSGEAPAQQQAVGDHNREQQHDEASPEPQARGDVQEETATDPAKTLAVAEEDFNYRALVLTGYGGYEKVKLQTKSGMPRPERGEVLVRVKACGLNFADLLARQGLYERLPAPPVTLGMECSGVIESVGEDVTDRKVGECVLVVCRSGLWQECVCVPADRCFLMPVGMSHEEAAALPINYITAYLLLFHLAHIRPGHSILVHQAAGGVGTAVTQLCHTVRDVTVFGTATSSKHDVIRDGGVTHPIDYRTRDYVEEIRKISPKGLDVVLDSLGGADTHKGFGLLKPMGTLIMYGGANRLAGPRRSLLALAKSWYNQFSIGTLALMQANKAVAGLHLAHLDDFDLLRQVLTHLLQMYTEGLIKPRIDSTYHFEQVGEAMRRMQERQNVGKVLLLPDPLPKTEEEMEKSEGEMGEEKKGVEEKGEGEMEEEKKGEEEKGKGEMEENGEREAGNEEKENDVKNGPAEAGPVQELDN